MRIHNALMKLAAPLIAAALSAATLQQAAGADVSLTPPPGPMPTAGSRVDLRLSVDGAVDLFGWQIEIAYPKSVLEFHSFQEGDFLKQGGSTFAVAPILKDIQNDPDQLDGSVLLAVTSTENGVDGSGLLGTLSFTVLSESEALLKPIRPKFLNSDEEQIAVANLTNATLLPNQAPTAVIKGPAEVETGAAFQLDATGSTDDYGIAAYMWSFGDGASAQGANVSHAYQNAGVYTVSLTVVDAQGASSKTTLTVEAVDPGDPAVRKPEGAFIVFYFNLPQAESDAKAHIKIWDGRFAVEEGMFLEYQTRIASRSPVYSVGIDAVAADGRTLSGSGAKDENNLSADPDADLSDNAVDKWYHRKIPLNALSGSNLVEISLAFKTGGHPGGVYRAFFDNIQITDGRWIIETIYANEANFPLDEPASVSAIEGSGGMEGVLHAGASAGELTAQIEPRGKLASVWANLKAE
ncbi:MAG: PKD domain-containing protein [Candidatus Poribacteria bacterium]|nr:PKD domain-containing protein [Candidatus Poribacteria bacterium]